MSFFAPRPDIVMDKLQTELYNLVAGVTGSEQIGFIDPSQQSLYGIDPRISASASHSYIDTNLYVQYPLPQ